MQCSIDHLKTIHQRKIRTKSKNKEKGKFKTLMKNLKLIHQLLSRIKLVSSGITYFHFMSWSQKTFIRPSMFLLLMK